MCAEPISDPYGINEKYYMKLHGWKVEWRQRESEKVHWVNITSFMMYYFHLNVETF